MKKLFLAAVITLASFIVPAHASDLTGEDIALACQGNVPDMKREKNAEEYAKFCNAYINAWDDARFAFLQGTRTYCPPKVTVKAMSVIFFDYLATHKEARKIPAAEALMLAFKDKWPCPVQAIDVQTMNTGNFRLPGCIALREQAATGRTLAAEQSFAAGFCAGQLNAALMYLPMMMTTAGDPAFCVSDQVTVGQFNLVVQKFLNEHPEHLHEAFTDILGEATSEAWPCPHDDKPRQNFK